MYGIDVGATGEPQEISTIHALISSKNGALQAYLLSSILVSSMLIHAHPCSSIAEDNLPDHGQEEEATEDKGKQQQITFQAHISYKLG